MTARSDGENDSSRRVKTEFLVQMQGVGNANSVGVLVLGATNLPWSLDPAVRRRFEKRIYISLPEENARYYLLKHQMTHEEHCLSDKDFHELAKATENYSGSDINNLIKNACYEPLRKFQAAVYFRQAGTGAGGRPLWMPCGPSEPGATKIDKSKLTGEDVKKNPITIDDFFKAVYNTKPTVGIEDLRKYVQWTSEFGMEG